MLEKLLIEYAKKTTKILTLSQQPNWIVKVTDKGLHVETERSRKTFEEGNRQEPWDLIPLDFLELAWSEFTNVRHASSKDFIKTNPRYSFFMSFFEKLPFIEKTMKGQAIAIRLKEFTTDQLPEAAFDSVKEFLDDTLKGKINPKSISKDFKSDKEKRLKSRARQGLKILGILNESFDPNTILIEKYQQAENKKDLIKVQILKQEYFKIFVEILYVIPHFTMEDKLKCLVEMGMLIVRNSRGENLMLESVSEYRTRNILGWLVKTGVIDEEWVPIINEEVRPLLLRFINEYEVAKKGPFAGSPLGYVVRNDLPKAFEKLNFINKENYIIKGSVGQGNWAVIPWIAVMNKNITTTTQRGYYIVYLLSEDSKRLYLTFAQGVTETTQEQMEKIILTFRNEIQVSERFKKDSDFNLGNSGLAKKYQKSVAAYIEYTTDNFPSENQILSDLKDMLNYYEQFIELKENSIEPSNPQKFSLSMEDLVNHIHSYINHKGFYYSLDSIKNLYLCLKTKPFVILSGISGTGKTQIIKLFAESIGATEQNGQFKLIPVRPDWSDGSDLIGFEDLKGEFKPGPLTKILQEANRAENHDKPYFILLDEMNLARVEYYFSDLLSVMESREKKDGEYISTPIVEREEVGKLMLRNNIYLIGTVNMDETTHPFSPKVLDRANTIEYNEVNLDHFNFLTELESIEPVAISNQLLAGEFLKLKDAFLEHETLIREVTTWLVDINKILELTNAHFGYRVRDEICFYMIYNEQGQLMPRNQAFDSQLFQKVLPRLTGNDAKSEQVLKNLYQFCTTHEWENGLLLTDKEVRYPKTAKKLSSMIEKIQNDGFTSFWLS
ncbi:MrcB family domain-containing protein [Heyndrickxia acidicola]|uniref:DUF3578 domain-containing protein n=1 Tax=Heyndrickxia acidicola TaxID=209389 RepID=A0ABU6MIS2_9BACI|nr:DUF3578 domain-containing protein [Heyndrickxia acidicola]MED1204209.1 DUF3578 domain-containing protein [Heyndrickxia acidicola]